MSNPILDEFRHGSTGDRWGDAMNWLFIIADAMTHLGMTVPSHWEYRHSPVCDGSELTDWGWLDMVRDGEWSYAELVNAGNVLSRYTDALRNAGESY